MRTDLRAILDAADNITKEQLDNDPDETKVGEVSMDDYMEWLLNHTVSTVTHDL